jgi:hypothetical protein
MKIDGGEGRAHFSIITTNYKTQLIARWSKGDKGRIILVIWPQIFGHHSPNIHLGSCGLISFLSSPAHYFSSCYCPCPLKLNNTNTSKIPLWETPNDLGICKCFLWFSSYAIHQLSLCHQQGVFVIFFHVQGKRARKKVIL